MQAIGYAYLRFCRKRRLRVEPEGLAGTDMDETGRGSELNNAAANSDGNGLGSVPRAELIHDVLDVDLDRFFGNEQKTRDVSIAISSRDFAQHLDFAGG